MGSAEKRREVRLPAFEIGFDPRVLQDVVGHEARKRPHPEELQGFVQGQEDAVDAASFEKVARLVKGFLRRVPGRPYRSSSSAPCAYARPLA